LLTADVCPWLGTEEDGSLRQTKIAEAHRCYARRPAWAMDPAHQFWYCLTDQHRVCKYYRETARAPAKPVPPPVEKVVDEVVPAPKSSVPAREAPVLRVLLWVATLGMLVAVLWVYGSTILGASPEATHVAVAASSGSPTVTPTPSPMATLQPVAVASPTFEFLEPTGTPTPYPGGEVYGLAPEAGAAGWVASEEVRGNHLGDSFLYAGAYDGDAFHGFFQINLAAAPRGATIHDAVLELTGLDDRRLGSAGTWEVRILAEGSEADWSRQTYQDVHNAAVRWTLVPALSAGELVVGETNRFVLSAEQRRDLEQRLLDEEYTVCFRLDGPLAGENSLYAWDTGYGPSSQGDGPRLVLSVGAAPETPIPTGSPPPTNTPEWFVITSTPTPANAMTAAAVALQATARATRMGTATPLPRYVATATPRYIVVTRTPTAQNYATAVTMRGEATANVLLTGTSTPTPHNLATATFTPRPARTPAVVWLDEHPMTATPTATPVPTALPGILSGKILFLSDRTGKELVYVYDPDKGRLGLVTARWPYEEARRARYLSPDGRSFAYAQKDADGVLQIYVYSREYGAARQVTFNAGMSYDPAWSPRGDKVAFVSTESGNDEVYVVGADGKGQTQLTFNEWEWDKHPSWSPDGIRIVFWSNQGSGRKQLWIMNADGSGRRLLLNSPYNDWDPVWVK
jgi:hypothetical protein